MITRNRASTWGCRRLRAYETEASNSVAGPPVAVAVTPDGRYALVVETFRLNTLQWSMTISSSIALRVVRSTSGALRLIRSIHNQCWFNLEAKRRMAVWFMQPRSPRLSKRFSRSCHRCHAPFPETDFTLTKPLLEAALQTRQVQTADCDRAGRTPCAPEAYIPNTDTAIVFLGQFISPILSQPLSGVVGLGVTYQLAGGLMAVMGAIALGLGWRWR